MGKPSKNGIAADALSLHTNPGDTSSSAAFLDDGDAPELSVGDDLPPNYSDALEDEEAAPMIGRRTNLHPNPHPWDEDALVHKDPKTGTESWLAKSVEEPGQLEAYVTELAKVPPRVYMQLTGTHTERRSGSSRDRDRDGSSRTTVTDFDVSVDVTPYLYSDAARRLAWNQLRTVEDAESTRRGTVLKKRAPGFSSKARQNSIEVGLPPKPTLQEWCHRFGASAAALKVFSLRRRVVGFDEALVAQRLTALVRDTNYRGQLRVGFVCRAGAAVDLYNDARVNRWRLTGWVQWLFCLTFLWLLSWPYLWLRTRRWEVAVAEWAFSRPDGRGGREYVSISEEQWYNMWARAVCRAVLEKRQATLDQADLRRAEEAGQPLSSTGNAHVDGALGIFRAGISAMNEVNRQLGWGGDC
ncbi:hypothetical protein GGR56DRAFT_87444 [Xylariaceae sp. FL0804]|nr:hypothetical protein GGR56DRAFT_87444 [Xylariaceae sp. FL0804]